MCTTPSALGKPLGDDPGDLSGRLAAGLTAVLFVSEGSVVLCPAAQVFRNLPTGSENSKKPVPFLHGWLHIEQSWDKLRIAQNQLYVCTSE